MDQLIPLKEIRDITFETLQTLKAQASGASVTKLVEQSYEIVVRRLDLIMNADNTGRKNLWERRTISLRKDG